MKMLLVWEEVPEKTSLYEIEMGTEQAEWAMASAGCYINGGDETEELNKLSMWLATQTPLPGSSSKEVYHGVNVCGFIM